MAIALVAGATVVAGCGRGASPDARSSEPSSTTGVVTTTTVAAPKSTFIMEMQKLTGENLFARQVYACASCSRKQFAAIPVPEGWVKGVAMQLLPVAEVQRVPNLAGVPPTMDFVAAIPGKEFRLLATVSGGELVAMSSTGPMAISQVHRATLFTYPSGTVVHEIIDTERRHYILFGVALGLIDKGLKPTDLNAFTGIELPAGWTYTSRTLDAPLVVDSGGTANVFTKVEHTLWQRYES
jgi:hypothetical protein